MKNILLFTCLVFLSVGIATAETKETAFDYKSASYEKLSELAQKGDFKAETEASNRLYHNRAFQEILELANKGDPLAQASVASKYYSGEDVEHNLLKAEEWYLKASAQGSSFAKSGLASLYMRGAKHIDGREVKKDTEKAMALINEAANQGHPSALYNLGSYYFSGTPPIKKDVNKAIELYGKAAENGNAMAAQTLGSYYYYGLEELPKDNKKAMFWYEKAVELGALHVQSDINKMKGIKKEKNLGAKPKQKRIELTKPLEREDFLELYDMNEYINNEKKECTRSGYSDTDCICELKDEYNEMADFMKEVLGRHPEWEGSRLHFKGERPYEGSAGFEHGQITKVSISTSWGSMLSPIDRFEKKMCSHN